MITTCSPNARRYKEFVKNGADKFYMPVWTLEELQVAGEYIRSECPSIDFSSKAIEDRYKRFGGIFRYVLPSNKRTVLRAEADQTSAMNCTKLIDVFAPFRSIEKTDSNKENISHFILHYEVEYG